jgi:hypothetical protein
LRIKQVGPGFFKTGASSIESLPASLLHKFWFHFLSVLRKLFH